MSLTTPDAARWQRIESLLHRVLDTPAGERAALLAAECADDAALRAEVESLAAASEGDAAPLTAGIAVSGTRLPPMAAPELVPGTRLGPWEVKALIGRGGMGEVYRAERADGSTTQTVAVKVLRAEAADHLTRFHAERRILARLEHPGIARLVDSGVTADGRPAMAMEFVQGVPLLEHARGHALDLAARLALFQQVCEAVAYAHASLVIHRDLKPGNVLVTREGRVKLLDFGVAKLLDPMAFGESTHTLTRVAPLTPGHAAPEQLQGQAITTATDVYALGVILFELLTGQAPWQLAGAPLSVALNRLLTEEPPRPSALADTAIPARLLRGDLDAICGKALRKDARDRYGTVAALSADIARHLAGEPVAAHRASEWYRIQKFVRRNRVAVGVAAMALVMAAGFVWRIVQAERRATAEAQAAQQVTEYLVSLFEAASPDKTGGKPIEPRRLVDEGRARLDVQLQDQPALRARMLATLGRLYSSLSLSNEGIGTIEQALAVQQRLPQADPLLTAEMWMSLGQMQYIQNQPAAAEGSFRKALVLRESALPAAALPVLDSLTHLGQTIAIHRDRREGVLLLERALKGHAAQRNTENEAAVLTYLQSHYQELGRLDEALSMSDRSLALTAPAADAGPGTAHLMALAYRSGLMQARGDWDEAERISRQLVDDYTRLLGPDSDWASNRRYWLGVLLYERGKISEAVTVLREDLASCRRVGRGGSDLAPGLVELANALRAEGALAEAETLHREAAPLLDAIAAQDPSNTRPAYGRALWARTRIAAGALDEAEDLLRDDIAANASDSTTRTRRALRRVALAELALARGDAPRALQWLDEAEAEKPPPLALPAEITALRLLAQARLKPGAESQQAMAAQRTRWREVFPGEAPWMQWLGR